MLLQRAQKTTSPGAQDRDAKHNSNLQVLAFHHENRPEPGSRKLLDGLQSRDWWLNIDYLDTEITDERECLKALLRNRRKACAQRQSDAHP